MSKKWQLSTCVWIRENTTWQKRKWQPSQSCLLRCCTPVFSCMGFRLESGLQPERPCGIMHMSWSWSSWQGIPQLGNPPPTWLRTPHARDLHAESVFNLFGLLSNSLKLVSFAADTCKIPWLSQGWNWYWLLFVADARKFPWLFQGCNRTGLVNFLLTHRGNCPFPRKLTLSLGTIGPQHSKHIKKKKKRKKKKKNFGILGSEDSRFCSRCDTWKYKKILFHFLLDLCVRKTARYGVVTWHPHEIYSPWRLWCTSDIVSLVCQNLPNLKIYATDYPDNNPLYTHELEHQQEKN